MLENWFRHTGAAVLGLSAACWAGTATAIPVTLAGTTVSFTFDTALAGLFGAPSVVGDSLFFTPTTFKAQSLNGAGLTLTSQTFNVAVSANPGYLLSAVNLTEAGDYFNLGSGSAVGVGGQLRMFDLEAPLLPAATSSIVAGAPLTAVTSLSSFATSNWNASASVTVPSSGWGGTDGYVTNVNVTVENLLLATTQTLGDGAFIEKKFTSLAIVTTPIPEPQAYLMFIAGLGLVGWVAWRRTGNA